MGDIWILGAAGRIGRAIAAHLAPTGRSVVLVGRDEARLRMVAEAVGGSVRLLVRNSLEEIVADIGRDRPSVVVNTIGPFSRTTPVVVGGCPEGTNYLDLANDLFTVRGLLDMNEQAVATGRTLISGAGFGVLATESIVLKLCEGQPRPLEVRVDAIASFDTEKGTVGAALAETIVDVLGAGGYVYANGQVTRASLGSYSERFTLPDGRQVRTGSGSSGDLEAAHRASGAPFVVGASSATPGSPLIRAIMPPIAALMGIGPIRGLAIRRLASVAAPHRLRSYEHSWARARIKWPSGTVRQGWLRTGDAMVFTAAVGARVAYLLADRDWPSGALTPGAAFGADLAIQAGGEFILE